MPKTKPPLEYDVEHKFMLLGRKFTFKMMRDSEFVTEPWKFHRKAARAYVDHMFSDDRCFALQIEARRLRLDHIQTVQGEYPTMDRLWAIMNKLEEAEQIELINYAFEIFQLKAKEETLHIKFSRYAGCTCPCSPGYIIDPTILIAKFDNFYINEVTDKPTPKAKQRT
jgi:hypothetical protein